MKTIILILTVFLLTSCQTIITCSCKQKSRYYGTEYKKEQKNVFEN